MVTNTNEYISIQEAAGRAGVSRQHFALLVRQGKVAGARKVGERVWIVPGDFVLDRRGRGRPRANVR
jgi:predicted DNA-binding protein (UPF0251 family)